jgi:hypothetical protein
MSKFVKMIMSLVFVVMMGSAVAPVFAGGGFSWPSNFCTSNVSQQIPLNTPQLNAPCASGVTNYVLSHHGVNEPATSNFNSLEAIRLSDPQGDNATYWSEPTGNNPPPPSSGNQASPPPSDFCKKPGFNPSAPNSGWSVGKGEHAWNACSGKIGAWMFQPNGTGDPIGHQRHKTFTQLENWRANHGYAAGTYWFDRYLVPSGACKSGSSVYIHLPTGVYPSAPCGAKSVYRMDIRGHHYQGSWKHLMYIRRCQYHGYEATIWVIEYRKSHHGCGCPN